MFRQTRDRRWTGRGPGAFTIAAVAAAAVAITSAAWPIGDSLAATRSLSSGALIGKAPPVIAHWAPVPYRRAQLSVPGGWLVEGPQGFFCVSKSDSMIFIGVKPRVPKGQSPGCRDLHASFAWIV